MWETVEELMRKRGIKASDITKATGVSASTLSEWKNGKHTPKADKLQKIADFFGVSIDYLLTGQEDSDVYYLSTETAKIAQEILLDKHKRLLFDAAQDCSADDLKFAADLLTRLKGTNRDA